MMGPGQPLRRGLAVCRPEALQDHYRDAAGAGGEQPVPRFTLEHRGDCLERLLPELHASLRKGQELALPVGVRPSASPGREDTARSPSRVCSTGMVQPWMSVPRRAIRSMGRKPHSQATKVARPCAVCAGAWNQ